jgi:hypothetical protein
MAIEVLPSLSEEELRAKAIESLPYPIHVYAADGTSVLVNEAILIEYHASDPSVVVGQYNVLSDPAVIATGQLHELRRAFQGETVFFQRHPSALGGDLGTLRYQGLRRRVRVSGHHGFPRS